MDILYTTDDNYLEIMLTSLHSLIVNSKVENIRLHIVTQNCNNTHFEIIKRFVDLYKNVELHIYRLEDNPIDNYNIPNWKGSQIANARLFYPRIIKDNVKDFNNLLYLDSDTLVVGDLTTLSQYNNNAVSACLDDSVARGYFEGDLALDRYYNSGVLYFNIDEYLRLDMEDRIRDFIKDNKEMPLLFPDQDLLNILLNEELSTLLPRYNLSAFSMLYKNMDSRLYFNANIRQVSHKTLVSERKNPVILHSYGISNIKPWIDNNINPFNKVFMEHMEYVNKQYKKEDLDRIKKLLTLSPTLFKYIYVIKTYLPESIQSKCTINSLRLIRNKKES